MQALILLQRYETFRYEQTFKQLFFMDAKQITNIITRVPQLVEKAMRDEIPRKTAVIAKNHFMHNFDESGFVNSGQHAWKNT